MKIITTVGTSIFENFSLGLGKKNDTFKLAYTHDEVGLKKKDFAYKEWNNTSNSVTQYREDIKTTIKQNNQFWNSPNASAEIRSIIEICKQDEAEYEVHLLATDTVLSVLAAELICEWFEREGNQEKPENLKACHFQKPVTPEQFSQQGEELYVIKGLRVNKKDTFEKGFMNLVDVLNKLIEKYKHNTILNITGGYKAIVPIVTLLGQLHEVSLKYMYKENELQTGESPLLEVGNLPFGFDLGFAEMYFDFLTKEGLKEIGQMPEILQILKKRGLIQQEKYKLTPLGQIFRDFVQPKVDAKKSDLGMFMEMVAFEGLLECKTGDLTIKHGRKIWWHFSDNSWSTQPKFGKDAKKERVFDVDILLKEKEGNEIWCEVKSCSSKGLNKAKRQIENILEFVEKASYPNLKGIRLLVYRLPKVEITKYQKIINQMYTLFKGKDIAFNLYQFELPINESTGLPITKKVFDNGAKFEKVDVND
ncbi:hypothetical protein AAG747_03615 [Rapidithrix thailandica]|uniref:CRISPR system ring nuclease SSO1393-like domain-containing protein n=1 Tax=Rapidithrix thailandica TaxID=413964 RepID=A0AAW9S6I9_9BACT